MTKFVTAAIVTAFAVVFTASAMAEGWRIGNWEPPKNEASPVLKDVSLGMVQEPATVIAVQVQANCAGVAASCAGVRASCVRATACFQQVGCAGRSVNVNGRWFPGRRMLANRRARSQARLGCN